eukprot:6621855-Alexandrium_andersonii.AAC.1
MAQISREPPWIEGFEHTDRNAMASNASIEVLAVAALGHMYPAQDSGSAGRQASRDLKASTS